MEILGEKMSWLYDYRHHKNCRLKSIIIFFTKIKNLFNQIEIHIELNYPSKDWPLALETAPNPLPLMCAQNSRHTIDGQTDRQDTPGRDSDGLTTRDDPSP